MRRHPIFRHRSLSDMAASLEMVAVVAMAQNRVIGDGSGLLWHLPADLKRVKALTMGCPLIMGRRTWDSIGRALPGRASTALSRINSTNSWSAPLCHAREGDEAVDTPRRSTMWSPVHRRTQNRMAMPSLANSNVLAMTASCTRPERRTARPLGQANL